MRWVRPHGELLVLSQIKLLYGTSIPCCKAILNNLKLGLQFGDSFRVGSISRKGNDLWEGSNYKCRLGPGY